MNSLFAFISGLDIPTVGIQFVSRLSLIPSMDDHPDLATAIQSGQLDWNDILAYGLYLIQFLLLFASVTFLIGTIQAGYKYILGAVVEEKEKGRDSLKHNFIGFALVVLAWAIVDIVIALLT